jgi:hypothetical protein
MSKSQHIKKFITINTSFHQHNVSLINHLQLDNNYIIS